MRGRLQSPTGIVIDRAESTNRRRGAAVVVELLSSVNGDSKREFIMRFRDWSWGRATSKGRSSTIAFHHWQIFDYQKSAGFLSAT